MSNKHVQDERKRRLTKAQMIDELVDSDLEAGLSWDTMQEIIADWSRQHYNRYPVKDIRELYEERFDEGE